MWLFARVPFPLVPALIGPAVFGLSACTTDQVVDASKNPAEQQLAVSTAVDHAVDNLKVEIAPQTRVFVDASYVDTSDKGIVLPKYMIGTVRDLILRTGARLADDRKSADVVAELRSGAQAVDRKAFLVGVPSFSIPVPLAGPLSTPELALYKRDNQRGISKIALTLYNAKTGALIDSTGPAYGDSHLTRYQALLVFTWSDQNIMPETIPQGTGGDVEPRQPSISQSVRREP